MTWLHLRSEVTNSNPLPHHNGVAGKAPSTKGGNFGRLRSVRGDGAGWA